MFPRKILLLLVLLLLLVNCKSTQINRKITKKLDSSFFDNQFTGLLIYNPKTKDTIIDYNADKYFIPASNTKIITLYTTLQILSDSIPAFKYRVDADTLSIRGTGDPTFLHTYFNDSTALKMMKDFKKVKLYVGNLSDYRYGPGWSWDDFAEHYSPERSSFPMYGNIVTIRNKDTLQSIPDILLQDVHISKSKTGRVYNENIFYYPEGKKKTIETPLVIDSLLQSKLWNAIAPNKVSISYDYSPNMYNTAYSIPTDSLLKRMMYVSDNFFAEQLLVLSSSTFSRNLSSYRIRQYILENQLSDLKHQPRWVDGSGLSRYNLFTPTSFVQILTKLYTQLPEKRLLNLFPVGGKSGTLKYWYAGNPRPYIFAKSGSLGNNYSLSGYLITNKGETLIFSFMNNHYLTSTPEIKKRMESIFEYLRDNY